LSDPWQLLGVPPTATYEEARHAFRVRSQLIHPDRHQGAGADVLREAERNFRELEGAWAFVRRQLMARGRAKEAAEAHDRWPPAPETGERPTMAQINALKARISAMSVDEVRLTARAATDEERLSAHRISLTLAQDRLALNQLQLGMAVANGNTARVGQLKVQRGRIEKIISAAESAVATDERLMTAGPVVPPPATTASRDRDSHHCNHFASKFVLESGILKMTCPTCGRDFYQCKKCGRYSLSSHRNRGEFMIRCGGCRTWQRYPKHERRLRQR
jgi:DnaJ domain